MKPRVVQQTALASTPPARPAYAGSVPEHNFRLSLRDWELTVFDNAVKFSVAWFKGRGNKGRDDFTDLEAAMTACRLNDRSVIYAVAASGRFTCLERGQFDALLTRWKTAKTS